MCSLALAFLCRNPGVGRKGGRVMIAGESNGTALASLASTHHKIDCFFSHKVVYLIPRHIYFALSAARGFFCRKPLVRASWSGVFMLEVSRYERIS